MEFLLTVLIFFLVIVLAAVLFAGWIFVLIVRAVVNAIRAFGRLLLSALGGRWITGQKVRGVRCQNAKCRAMNPPEARFCRRCGSPMRQPIRVTARRAAVL